MTKNSSHKRWKGCCMLCGHHLDEGQAARKTTNELRFIGKNRRVSRHDLGDYLERDDD